LETLGKLVFSDSVQFFHHVVWNGNHSIKLANLKFEVQIWKTQMCVVEPD